MTIQMTSLHQVSASSAVIIAKHTIMPKMGKSGKQGHYRTLVYRLVLRNTMTPAQTMIKASSVPMDVMFPNFEIGKNPAKNPVKTMNNKFDRHGVRHWGWMSEKSFGKSPSRDMA